MVIIFGKGTAGFFDSSIWEDAELHGDTSVKRLINSNLQYTSVTCVLIGSQTWSRRWVRYEIFKSYDKNNLMLGVHINGIQDRYKRVFLNGSNPFEYVGLYIDANGKITYMELYNGKWQPYLDLEATQKKVEKKYWNRGYIFSDWVPCYDWVTQNGYLNFGTWIYNAK